MGYRVLGRTGARVSPLCLGAMMFGKWGIADLTDCIRIVHRALDAGSNMTDTVPLGRVTAVCAQPALESRQSFVPGR